MPPTNAATDGVTTDGVTIDGGMIDGGMIDGGTTNFVTSDGTTDDSGVWPAVTLLCCVEAIDHQLSVCRPEDRWHWQSRRNSAVFLLNRLADSAARRQTPMDIGQLPREQRQAIANSHSLLCPLDL